MATTNLGRVAIVPKGVYDVGTTYEKLDLVTGDGGSYMYINPTPAAGVSLTDTTHWQQIASMGGQDLVDAAVAARDEAQGYKDDAANSAAQLAAGVASAKGSFADLAALNTADPNHDFNYVTLDNGHWAHYDTGTSAFVDSGFAYQSVANPSLVVSTPAATGDALVLYTVPDIADAYDADTYELTRNCGRVSLSGAMYTSMVTDPVNFDTVYISTSNLPGILGNQNLGSACGQTVLVDKNGITLVEGGGSDIPYNIGKYSLTVAGLIYIHVAKDTYADIAAARTDLGTMTLTYQLTTPVVTTVYPTGFHCDLSTYYNFIIVTDAAADRYIYLDDPPSGLCLNVTMLIDYVEAATLIFPASVVWQNGAAPTFTAGKKYIVLLVSYDDGVTWLGSVAGSWL
ncbi:MAG: hypothetical protein PHX74_02040 [Candidatus Sumerlaeales bacterium]|nr:hypothetical protein [Candidatus Sumerlaeales bacterium]